MGRKRVWAGPYEDDGTPRAYDEALDPDPFWRVGEYAYDDPGDKVVPSLGLISDFVYFMRGTESPTIYQVWSMLFAIATCVKREAWLKWSRRGLLWNHFTILVGPAGLVKKSFSIGEIVDVILGMRLFIQNQQLAEMKHIALVTGKVTPEALLEALWPKRKRGPEFPIRDSKGNVVKNERGETLVYKKTSEVGVALTEMASVIGRKEYMRGIIEDLLELYDPKEHWPWRTVKRGVVHLRKTHTTMIAATTPTGFRDSIPESARADGFLSRTAVVYQDRTARCFEEPIPAVNGPTFEDLRRRLAWVVEHAVGEYDLSEEARAWRKSWYRDHKARLEANPHLAGRWSRLDIFLNQIAFMIHVQRYDRDTERRLLEVADFKEADRLLRWTQNEAISLLRNLGGDSVDPEIASRVAAYLKRVGRVTRLDLLRKAHVSAGELNESVDQLVQEGRARILREGQVVGYVSSDGEEVYEWIADVWAEQGSGSTGTADVSGLPEPSSNGKTRRAGKGRSPSNPRRKRSPKKA